MSKEILYISDIDITFLILSGFYKGILFSLSAGFIAQGLNYCIKLLSNRG